MRRGGVLVPCFLRHHEVYLHAFPSSVGASSGFGATLLALKQKAGGEILSEDWITFFLGCSQKKAICLLGMVSLDS